MKQFNYYFTAVLLFLFVSNVQLYADEKETVTAIPANEFLRSIGVNTSINTRGETILKTMECVSYIGARYVRSGPPDGVIVRLDHFRWLYEECGVRFSMALSTEGDPILDRDYPGGIPYLLQGAKDVIAAIGNPDALIAFEGCNEPNNWGNIYQGEKGGGHRKQEWNEDEQKWEEVSDPQSWKPLARYHRDFYAAAKEDPILGTSGYNYPVWSATDVGAAWENTGMHFLEIPAGAVGVDAEFPAGTKFADVACIHNYFVHPSLPARTNNQTWKAADPTGTAGNTLKNNFGVTWSKSYQGYSDEQLKTLPRVTTETGTTVDYNMSEEFQALNFLSCYLAQFVRGFQYTAMYILRDRSDEGGNQSFGFYNTSYQPRLGAHYLHNMTTVLSDEAPISNPGTLRYALSSRPQTVHELLLQKSNGVRMLVVWSEKFARGSEADNIEVQFDETFKKINVYNPAQYDANDPEKGIRPVATYENVNAIPLSMLNNPFIIEIEPVETSIEETIVNQATKIYPNPVEDVLYIKHAAGLKKVEFYDLTGKNVFSRFDINAKEISIDVSHLSKGYYALKITGTNKRTESQKIIKVN